MICFWEVLLLSCLFTVVREEVVTLTALRRCATPTTSLLAVRHARFTMDAVVPVHARSPRLAMWNSYHEDAAADFPGPQACTAMAPVMTLRRWPSPHLIPSLVSGSCPRTSQYVSNLTEFVTPPPGRAALRDDENVRDVSEQPWAELQDPHRERIGPPRRLVRFGPPDGRSPSPSPELAVRDWQTVALAS